MACKILHQIICNVTRRVICATLSQVSLITTQQTAMAWTAIAVWILIGEPLSAQPREILIIRHAEKPDSSGDPNLTPRGYARAVALLPFFSSTFDTPDYVFATQGSKHSNRPVQTITPLAGALHMALDSKVADADYVLLAQDILTNPQYKGKMLIICWHHGTIPALAKALGISDPPQSWPDTVFDRVWRIQYTDSGPTLANLPQHILFGDSKE